MKGKVIDLQVGFMPYPDDRGRWTQIVLVTGDWADKSVKVLKVSPRPKRKDRS